MCYGGVAGQCQVLCHMSPECKTMYVWGGGGGRGGGLAGDDISTSQVTFTPYPAPM